MKKIWKYFIVFILANMARQSVCIGQITLDTTLMPLNGWGFDMYPVQISATESKYLFSDSVNNTFSLYNMDFTPFLLNIAVPEPFATWTFQVLYVTRTLFDCDSTNIEFVYEATLGGTGNNPFYIMRTDGTQLFKRDSAYGAYCLGGCLGLTDILRPIRNTSSGAKLFLHIPGGNGQLTSIYSLCGTLHVDGFDFSEVNQSVVKLFPNPTTGSLTFQISAPDNVNEYELVIVDNNAKELRREKINLRNDKYVIDVSNFSSGIYYYSLCTKNKAYQSGKFVLNK